VTPLDEALRADIAGRGPLPYEEVVERALYDPDHGFYATTGRAGRRGDFLTSPEVGPLFGAVVARALDTWWEEAGRPHPWTVIDAGAGPGTLARSVRFAEPACWDAIRYVLVERSAAQRESHEPLLVEAGGRVESRADLPPPAGPAVVLANELLDNLPFGLAERTPHGWAEVRVGVAGDDLVDVLEPMEAGAWAGLAPDVAPGSRIPLQAAAQAWLRAALEVAGAGRVVVIDYASTTADLAAREPSSWLRTYRRHGRGEHPLQALGTQDVTCEVCTDQLEQVAPAAAKRPQHAWLTAHGIDELVDEGRRTWGERSPLGDLAAVRARSRISEAQALLDPDGLGLFTVLEWHSPDR
jgi:SAM-dependent MidA family methyltransferase